MTVKELRKELKRYSKLPYTENMQVVYPNNCILTVVDSVKEIVVLNRVNRDLNRKEFPNNVVELK